MADAPDKESKTEQPTEKRVHDALEKGNSPLSSEATTLGSMLALLAVGGLMVSDFASHITEQLSIMLSQVGTTSIGNGADVGVLLRDNFASLAAILLPVLAILAVGGLIGSLAQNVPQASIERVMPKLERISPAANAKRIFGAGGLVQFGKTAFKSIVISVVTYYALRNAMVIVLSASAGDVGRIPEIVLQILMSVIAPLCLAALLLAIADMVWARQKWWGDLMMSRQELKDEMRQSEGDPQVKQRQKILARDRRKKGMMAELPKATVVVVNPTHFAVAMRYVPSEGGAPLVLAKGIDHLALRIRGLCEELGVPVVENKSLARSLYASTKTGEMIPAELYRAVAEVIHFVEMRKRLGMKKN